jgi:hypothetical protein
MKTTQDYTYQVLSAHRLMLNRYYGIAVIRVNNKKQTVKQFATDSIMLQFATHSIMLHIAYDMIMRGEY